MANKRVIRNKSRKSRMKQLRSNKHAQTPVNTPLKLHTATIPDESIPDSNSENDFGHVNNTPQKSEQINSSNEVFSNVDMSGRRIVNVIHFFTEITTFRHCELFSCSSSALVIEKEKRNGFISTFTVTCTMCKNQKKICTEPEISNTMDINKAAVLGSISIGGGYSQLKEFSANLDMPCMSSNTYLLQQTFVATYVKMVTWELIADAGREEYNIAMAKGQIDSDGTANITVIVDGAWSKRSYKTNYDAPSGVAIVIGQATRKVLFVGIRNKYCCICSRANTENIEASAHACYKNWEKSSTAMESDIIMEAFKCSVAMHNLKYTSLVGDGDSSVYKKIIECRPYTYKMVQKIECSNHLLRNLCSRMRELTKKRSNSKSTNVPIRYRKFLESHIKRIRCGVQGAVKFNISSQEPHQVKIFNLREDILNCIKHIFGSHGQCRSYFCLGPKEDEENLLLAIQDCGLFDDLMIIMDRMANHAESLIINMHTNAAELYNSIVAKYTGGKRINFSSKNSYEIRCQAAVIQFNSGPAEISRKINKKTVNRSPGSHTKQYIKAKNRRLKWTNSRKNLFKTRKQTSLLQHADEDYGDVEPDITKDEYEKKSTAFLKTLEKEPEDILALERATCKQTNSMLWKEERYKRLTASYFGVVCKQKKSTNCSKLVQRILYSNFKGNDSTRWGLAHEKSAIRKFSEINQISVQDCGLFLDQEIYFLGASPDGLINEEGIIEVKCPTSCASLTPREAIIKKKIKFATLEDGHLKLKTNHDYFYQIQGQLHITRRKYCIFVIWSPKGIETETIFKDDTFWKSNMEGSLIDFYLHCLLPELCNPQFSNKRPIKDLRRKL